MTRIERPARATTSATATQNAPKSPSRTSFAPMLLDSPEKKSVSNTIVPTSAIEEPAITSCPNGVSTCPASFSTAITIPRPVAENITAISRGERTRPAPFKASPQTSPSATDAAKPSPVARRSRPLRRS
jgi:hypothetical protein